MKPAWSAFNDWNVRSEAHTRTWAAPLPSYLIESGLIDKHSRVLDYGCGAFDLGVGIAPRCARIDGFEPHGGSASFAAERARALGNAAVYNRLEDVPRAAYDVVVAASVIQYMNEAELDEFLERAAGFLAAEGKRSLLITDILPIEYSPFRDALNSLRVALGNKFFFNMVSHLGKSALNRHGSRLTRHDPEAFARRAAVHHYSAQRLADNLTPSRQRYTFLLVHPGGSDRGRA